MKRYEIFGVDISGFPCNYDERESDDGKWVRYSDIKSDRALLDDAVMLLKNIYDMTVYQGDDVVEMTKIKLFIARAKERLG